MALEGGILGRTDEMVVVRGVNIYPSAVEDILRAHGGVGEYQVEVSKSASLSEIAIRVEPLADGVDAASFGRSLGSALQTAFNLRVPVTVVARRSLPRFEMKAHRWVRV
jgi:phenylacetate-CoA ligase